MAIVFGYMFGNCLRYSSPADPNEGLEDETASMPTYASIYINIDINMVMDIDIDIDISIDCRTLLWISILRKYQ